AALRPARGGGFGGGGGRPRGSPPPPDGGPRPASRSACSLALRHARSRAVLVLLGGTAARAAGALDHAVADDGHRALTRDHVPALGGHDSLHDGIACALRQLPAGPPEGDGGDGLALGPVGARPDGAVHAVEGDEPPACVAHRHADLDVELAGLVDGPLHNPVRFSEGERHGKPPLVWVNYEAGTVRCASSSKYSGKVLATHPGFSITTGSLPQAAREKAMAMRWSL